MFAAAGRFRFFPDGSSAILSREKSSREERYPREVDSRSIQFSVASRSGQGWFIRFPLRPE